MILIAGAGLAGLSAAFHLGGREYRIIEKEARPGGLCRTERAGSYDFDYGGHLLHLKSDDIRSFVKELLGDGLVRHQRRSAVFSHGVFTPYPFQVNTHGLPPEVIQDCVLGFVEARLQAGRHVSKPANFEQWIQAEFGDGFVRHFFSPFNRKFFKVELSELTSEWAGWSVPRPELRDVISGALGIRDKEFGYNIEFFYPKDGIEQLPRALVRELPRPVETETEIVELDLRQKLARLSTGEELKYDKLISTIPLDRLLALCVKLPAELREAASGLRVLSVICLNLGVKTRLATDQHWIYYPEQNYCFHRVGVYSNFMKVKAGRSSLYLEISVPGPAYSPIAARTVELMEQSLTELSGAPLWKGGEGRIEEMMALLIPHAYVIYDRRREKWLPRIVEYLGDRGVELAGRYARWEYAAMEDALRQGKEVATKVARTKKIATKVARTKKSRLKSLARDSNE